VWRVGRLGPPPQGGAATLSPCGREGGEVDAWMYPPWLRHGYAVADPLGGAGGRPRSFPVWEGGGDGL
jgi:hypothetical protein